MASSKKSPDRSSAEKSDDQRKPKEVKESSPKPGSTEGKPAEKGAIPKPDSTEDKKEVKEPTKWKQVVPSDVAKAAAEKIEEPKSPALERDIRAAMDPTASIQVVAANLKKVFDSHLAFASPDSTRAKHISDISILFDEKKPAMDEDEAIKIRVDMLEIHGFYSKMTMHPPNCSFDDLSDAVSNMQIGQCFRFLKDYGVNKYLASKEEITECFHYACGSRLSLNIDQFMNFVFNLARLMYSRPPHNVNLERCLPHFYDCLITDHFRTKLLPPSMCESATLEDPTPISPLPVSLSISFAPFFEEFTTSTVLGKRLGVKPGAAVKPGSLPKQTKVKSLLKMQAPTHSNVDLVQ